MADGHAQHFAPAIGVDAHCHDHGDRDDVVVAAGSHVRGVQPDIGPITLDLPISLQRATYPQLLHHLSGHDPFPESE
jgi:hypothetical protein